MAGVSFILPAAFLVLAIAAAYMRYGSRPEAVRLLYGIKPMIIAIVVQALWRLGRQALRSAELVLIAVLGVALSARGVNELVVLFGAGLLLALGDGHAPDASENTARRRSAHCPSGHWPRP